MLGMYFYHQTLLESEWRGGEGCLNISFTNPLPNGMIVDSGLSEIETKQALCRGKALQPPHSSTLLSLPPPHTAQKIEVTLSFVFTVIWRCE